MNPHQRRQLDETLRAMPKAQQDALFKRAADARREAQERTRGERRRFEDIDEDRATRGSKGGGGKRKLDPVRVYALKLLAKDLASAGASGGASVDQSQTSPGREPGVAHTPGLGTGTGTGLGVRTGVAVMVGKRRCLVREDQGRAAEQLPQSLRDSSPFGKGRARNRPAIDEASPSPDSSPGGTHRPLPREGEVADGDGGADADIECRLPASLAGRQQTELCVGDRVAFAEVETPGGETVYQLSDVLQRDTVLTRRDPRTGERRAIVANVDAVVVVVSVVSPPLHPRLIDRYLLAIEDSWVERAGGSHADDPDPAAAVIAVNKVDLLRALPEHEQDEERAKLEPYRAMGLPVVECSATGLKGEGRHGLDELCRAIAGKTVAFVGHSGVGKSSLTNALDPRLGIRVSNVGSAANRGRHTTTSSQMHDIEREVTGGDGSMQRVAFRVIDTPGIRYFGLDELTPAELRDSFPEFRRLRQSCKFNDCTHTHEPGCAVLAAVEAGELHEARYETYVRLLEEIERGPRPPTERIRPMPETDDS